MAFSILQQLCFLLVIQLAVFVSSDPLVDNVDYIIVIYEENWSFDAMFGDFPGANGFLSNKSVVLNPQTDKNGVPYTTLPAIFDIPGTLPNLPFEVDPYINDTLISYPDPTHKYYEEQYMINGGRMDKYIAWNDASSISYSWWNSTDEYIWQLAQQYTLFDNFFHSAFGPSLLNHFWLACACTPKWESEVPPPSNIVANIVNGFFNNSASPLLTPDWHIIGTLSPQIPPIDPSYPANELVPPITNETLGDQLNVVNVSWAFFQDGYNDAISGHASPVFEYNHNPYLYFAKYANGTELRARHMKDTQEFIANITSGNIPQVSFIKPMSPHNFHPHVSDRYDSQMYLRSLINGIKASPIWNRTVVVVTFDEHGGFWDHVPPPQGDQWGPGSRVPAIVVSPFAKNGYVDHTETETLSILKLIQRRFDLPNLGIRQAKTDISSALQFPNATDAPTSTPTPTPAPATPSPTPAPIVGATTGSGSSLIASLFGIGALLLFTLL